MTTRSDDPLTVALRRRRDEALRQARAIAAGEDRGFEPDLRLTNLMYAAREFDSFAHLVEATA